MPINFRTIRAEEIDLRVGSTKKEKYLDKNGKEKEKVIGFSLLLFKDARVDANILDSTIGIENWQCKYYQVKNTMVCSVGININYDDETKEPLWIWKDDGGDDDYQTEKIKAELSDSFKRACFRFSIGRELYDSPFIWIEVTADNTPFSHYSVKEIEYDSKKHIIKLVIINEKTKQVVYSFGNNVKVAQTSQKEPKKPTSDISMEQHENDCGYINTYLESLEEKRREGFVKWICQFQQVNSLDELRSNVDKCHAVAEWLRKKGI